MQGSHLGKKTTFCLSVRSLIGVREWTGSHPRAGETCSSTAGEGKSKGEIHTESNNMYVPRLTCQDHPHAMSPFFFFLLLSKQHSSRHFSMIRRKRERERGRECLRSRIWRLHRGSGSSRGELRGWEEGVHTYVSVRSTVRDIRAGTGMIDIKFRGPVIGHRSRTSPVPVRGRIRCAYDRRSVPHSTEYTL